MDIYLIRHADAIPFSDFSGRDEDRPLTERGREECARLGHAIRSHSIRFDRVYSSPLKRTRETAQELIHFLQIPLENLQIQKDLAPGGKCKRLAKTLTDSFHQSVALVGHMPDLSDFAGWLLGSKKVEFTFSKSGIALLRSAHAEIEKGCAELLWFLSPEWYQ